MKKSCLRCGRKLEWKVIKTLDKQGRLKIAWKGWYCPLHGRQK